MHTNTHKRVHIDIGTEESPYFRNGNCHLVYTHTHTRSHTRSVTQMQSHLSTPKGYPSRVTAVQKASAQGGFFEMSSNLFQPTMRRQLDSYQGATQRIETGWHLRALLMGPAPGTSWKSNIEPELFTIKQKQPYFTINRHVVDRQVPTCPSNGSVSSEYEPGGLKFCLSLSLGFVACMFSN